MFCRFKLRCSLQSRVVRIAAHVLRTYAYDVERRQHSVHQSRRPRSGGIAPASSQQKPVEPITYTTYSDTERAQCGGSAIARGHNLAKRRIFYLRRTKRAASRVAELAAWVWPAFILCAQCVSNNTRDGCCCTVCVCADDAAAEMNLSANANLTAEAINILDRRCSWC